MTNEQIANAQWRLGWMYEIALDVPQDYKEAAKWYRKAAEKGHVRAQCELGLMYGKGRGVPQDYVEAHKWLSLAEAEHEWLNLAEAEGTENASKNLDRIAKEMTDEQIAEAQRLAREWKPKKTESK